MRLPDWLAALNLPENTRYDEPPGGRLRARGGDADPLAALEHLSRVLLVKVPGYRVQLVRGGVQHAHGPRLTWMVEWIEDGVADRQYRSRLERYHKERTGE